jgi:cardiolipin synthase
MARIPPFVAATRRLLEATQREPELPLEVIAWRDTDLLVRGPVVAEAERLFARLGPSSARTPPPPRAAVESPTPSRTGRRAAIVDHVPGDDDPILASLLKAIDGARRSVELENAYVIRPPGLVKACADAVARGVRVRLLTNSLESLDEAILGYAVLRTAHEFAASGVEVYVKQGDTLHSKFALVDGEFAQLGSYNLHPRSRHLEGEVVVNLLDPSAVAALRAAFEQDVAAARRVRGPADAPLPDDPLGRLAWRWFPDLL